jgi:hypothetical protein
MQTCREDGVVLKPDRPITTPDWCFENGGKGETCDVFTTASFGTNVQYVRERKRECRLQGG